MSNRIEQQNQLVLEHLYLAYRITNTILSKLPTHIQRDDIVSVALIGLVTAASRFDPTRQVLFRTFAERHIRGSIIDELRTTDIMKRTAREKFKQMEEEIHKLEGSLGYTPDNYELAESMGLSLEDYYKMETSIDMPVLVSLDDSRGTDGDAEVNLSEVISDSPLRTPTYNVAGEQIANLIYRAIGKLTQREKLIVCLYYGEEIALKDIGKLLNRTESRISQLLLGAMKQIKENLTGAG